MSSSFVSRGGSSQGGVAVGTSQSRDQNGGSQQRESLHKYQKDGANLNQDIVDTMKKNNLNKKPIKGKYKNSINSY